MRPIPPNGLAGLEQPDLANFLPPGGQRHYRLVLDATRDSAAIGHGLASRLIEATERRQAASMRLAQIRGKRGVTADHPEMVSQTTALADADSEIARINERVAMHNVIAGPRADLLRNIDAWLRSTAGSHDIIDVELVEVPKLLKGETPATAIDRLRRRLRELNSDRRRIEASPFPSSYSKQVAAAHINKLADAAAPIVTNLVEHGGGLVIDGVPVEPPIVFPTKMVSAQVDTATGRGVAIGEVPDVVGLVAFVCRDLLLAKINELIDAESENGIALTHEQRAEQLRLIAEDRLHVSQEESFWIWQAFAAGVVIEPRSDMDVAAFLQVQTLKAPRPAGTDHADAAVRVRDAASAAESGVPFTPADIHIPGMTS